MTTEQMDAIDDANRSHRMKLIAFDVWTQGLGLSVGEWDRLWSHSDTHIVDLWAQILCALSGNHEALLADTNPPAPDCLINAAIRRDVLSAGFDQLSEMFDGDGLDMDALLQKINRYATKMERDIAHLEDEVERLEEELAAASTLEVDRDDIGLLHLRYPDGRPDWVKASPEVLDKIVDAHNARLNEVFRLNVWKDEATRIILQTSHLMTDAEREWRPGNGD